jgi:glucokinase
MTSLLPTGGKHWAIGIDVGGTKLLGGVLSADGTVLFHHRIPTRRGNLLNDLVSLLETIMEELRRRDCDVRGIGVGITGFVDRTTGRLIESINMGLSDVPIGPTLSARTGLPVFVDNDVHAAAVGEIRFGIGRDCDDFLLYNAGTGLAAGIVFGGKLYRGANNAAGENGHISSDQSGQSICSCGMSGDIEQLILDARAGQPTVAAYLPKIQPPERKEYGYLALNLIQLVNFMNPAAIVLTGGMFTGDPIATEWVKRAVYAHALPIMSRSLKSMDLSRTAPLTGLFGAATLVLDALAL